MLARTRVQAVVGTGLRSMCGAASEHPAGSACQARSATQARYPWTCLEADL